MSIKQKIVWILLVALVVTSQSNADVLFEDDFDSYTYDSTNIASQSSVWQGEGAEKTIFASWHPGKAYFSNGTWGDNTMRIAYADVGADDYTVSVDAYAVSGYLMEYYATARCTDTQYVAAGVVTDGTSVYARVIDSEGASSNDYWFGQFDPNGVEPMHIELTVEGEDVSAYFSTQGLDTTIYTTTTILTGSNAGFAGKYQWNYPLGRFDNFVVEGVSGPIAGDLNEDSTVDIQDFALLASDWMECTDPEDVNCDAFWK